MNAILDTGEQTNRIHQSIHDMVQVIVALSEVRPLLVRRIVRQQLLIDRMTLLVQLGLIQCVTSLQQRDNVASLARRLTGRLLGRVRRCLHQARNLHQALTSLSKRAMLHMHEIIKNEIQNTVTWRAMGNVSDLGRPSCDDRPTCAAT